MMSPNSAENDDVLTCDVQERLTAKEAMAHAYFAPVRNAAAQNHSASSSHS